MDKKKLWGGRFSKQTDALVDDFNSSIHFDYKMYRQDIKGSMAHAKMLGKCGIIPVDDAQLIVKTLEEILADIEQGKVTFSVQAEDIHMNVETILIERIGEVGKRLHTGRSRNDQVALDIRMYLMDETDVLMDLLTDLMKVLYRLASENKDTIMPGYTHLQKAQPINFAHHILAYFEMFRRDFERLTDCKKRTNRMPLGSGALAGTTYPLDRELVAKELGFDEITRNSLDGVSDRDFVLELALELCNVLKEKFGIDSCLTRETDSITLGGYTDFELDSAHISLRGEYAAEEDCDLFVSLHTNSNEEDANGYPTFFQPMGVSKPIIFVNSVALDSERAIKIANATGTKLASVNFELGLAETDEFCEVKMGAIEEIVHGYNDSATEIGTVVIRKGKKDPDYYGVLRGASNVGVPGMIIEHGHHSVPVVRRAAACGALTEAWANADAEGIAYGFGFTE